MNTDCRKRAELNETKKTFQKEQNCGTEFATPYSDNTNTSRAIQHIESNDRTTENIPSFASYRERIIAVAHFTVPQTIRSFVSHMKLGDKSMLKVKYSMCRTRREYIGPQKVRWSWAINTISQELLEILKMHSSNATSEFCSNH